MVKARSLLSPIFGVIVVILILLYTNPVIVLSEVKHLQPIFILLAAGTEVLGGVLYTLAWYLILKPSGVNVSFRRAYLITMGSLFLVYTTPSGVAAEAVRINMTRKHSDDYGGPTASVIMHRMLYALGFISVAGVATFMVYSALSSSPFIRTVFYAILSTIILVTVALILSTYANWLRGFVKQILTKVSPLTKKIFKKEIDFSEVDKAFDSFATAIHKIKRSPVRLLTSYLVIAIRWILVSVVALLVMYSLHYTSLSIWGIMIVMMIAELVSTTPIGIPGMLGVLDAAIIGSYVALGVPLPIATAADLLTRLVLYVVNIPLTGSLFYVYINKTHSHKENNLKTV
jgi:uncharacterized protein (TIRG00374 family)